MRIENSIKALSRVSDLYIYSRVPQALIGGVDSLSFYKNYCRAFYFAPSPRRDVAVLFKGAVNRISRTALRRNVFSSRMESRSGFRGVLETARAIEADAIWLGYGNISYPLLKYIKETSHFKVVLDTDSVWSRFVLRGLPYARDEKHRRWIEAEGRSKEREERWGTRMADVTTAVSEVDMEYYAQFPEDKAKIMRFSNVIDPESYGRKPRNTDMRRPSVYLAGSFGHGSPMEEAAYWMIDRVMPILWKEYPTTHLYIVGTGSKETLASIIDTRISILGRVDSVLPYLCNADVAVVPLKYESGTRFKILEAAACSVPIVSTTLGAEGLSVTHGKNILIADAPEVFAGAIKELLSDAERAKRLATDCKRLVLRDYSTAAAEMEARAILEHLQMTVE